ncbi:hemolysin secretion protein D [Kaistia sp. 32K]|uniref:HlyD family secretion protein n=1 Tax=Kaistia sp. 32K TaxID=2795690 RepID=UPI001915E25B|nr:HlyD family efflux transporter periplasmic adaptor subunit [Kaistia sp. 32K]BCP51774.1 hemolysin secretion protein D [Kaistia sp. 32K]
MRHPWPRAALVAFLAVFATDAVTTQLGAGSWLVSEAAAQNKLKSLIDRLRGNPLPAGIAQSNGRIEGQEIDISSKYPGRLASVDVHEGDTVEAGQVVARIDDREYRAQLLGAQAQVLRAESALSEVDAQITQRDSDRALAQASFDRINALFQKGHATAQLRDEAQNKLNVANAAYQAMVAARAQAESTIKAAEADVSRLNAILEDMVLVAPRRGRVQYELARAGEVVGAGTRVLTLLDLSDISMSIYLPAKDVAGIGIGDEARIILDPIPDYVIPATVTFVSGEAQFTPKTVETKDEREKLMFRVKLQIPRALVQRFEKQVKVGVRGTGFVRTSLDAEWPESLKVNVPQ